MKDLYLVIWFVLLPVNCLGRVYSTPEEMLLSKDIAHSDDSIFTAKSPADNLISEDIEIDNSPANENEVQQKQLDANQPNNFMSQENLREKNDESETKNTKQQKQLDAKQADLMNQENVSEKNDGTGTKNTKQHKQLDAKQANFMSQENQREKNDGSGMKNTKQQKQQYSNQPIFTVDNPGYNPIKEKNEKVKKKSLKSRMKKLFPGGK